MTFEWRRWLASVQPAYSNCATSSGRSQRPSAILSAVRPWPHRPLALRQVRERAGLDLEALEALENLGAQRRHEAVAHARDVDKGAAFIIAGHQRIEVSADRDIAANHQLLPLVDAHLHPGAGAPAGLVAAVAPLGDDAFQALLASRRGGIGGRGLKGIGEPDDPVRQLRQHLGLQQRAALLQRPLAQVLTAQVQKVEGVELQRRAGMVVVLQHVEGGEAVFGEGHHLAIDDRIVRQLGEGTCDLGNAPRNRCRCATSAGRGRCP